MKGEKSERKKEKINKLRKKKVKEGKRRLRKDSTKIIFQKRKGKQTRGK